MEDGTVRLAQYAAFSAARLHFSRLFFQTTAFVLAALFVGALIIREADAPLRICGEVGGGLALIQAAFIVSRLQRQETRYEALLQSIEEAFDGGLRQPTSGRWGAKTSVVVAMFALGLLIVAFGVSELPAIL